MKIEITTLNHLGLFEHEYVNLCAAPHNIRFDCAESNHIFLRLIRYPVKDFSWYLSGKEGKEVEITSCLIRASFTVQGVQLAYIVQYSTKTGADTPKDGNGNIKSRYTVEEKEVAFPIESNKKETIRLVEPFLWHIRDVNSKKDADLFLDWYDEWVHPVTLESVTATLTEDQKLKAAKMLKAYFAA